MTISNKQWETLTGRKIDSLVTEDTYPEYKHNLMNFALCNAFDNLVHEHKEFMLVLVDFLSS